MFLDIYKTAKHFLSFLAVFTRLTLKNNFDILTVNKRDRGMQMNKKITIEYLSTKLSYSKTTISKALNNFPGIDNNTKRIIREAAEKEGYHIKDSQKDIAVILPSVPEYFWGRLRQEIARFADAHGMQVKYYTFQNLSNSEDARQCVESAFSLGASVILCAMPDTPAVRESLSAAADNAFVLLLEEFMPIDNTYFVGGDPYDDGYRLASVYLEEHSEMSSFAVLRVTEFENEKRRVEGFAAAAKEINQSTVTDVLPNCPYSKAAAASYARALSELSPFPDCLFCPSGGMSKGRLAAIKLKRELPVIGFDDNVDVNAASPASPESYKHIQMSLKQDIPKLAEQAMKLVLDFVGNSTYPEKQYTFIQAVLNK